MPSSRRDNSRPNHGRKGREPRDFTQLGLDFTSACGYIMTPRKETDEMNQELFETLDKKVGDLLERYTALKAENARLSEENQRFQAEREGLKSRVDVILGKLEGI
jgi:cell division protein ZapB